MAEVLYDSTYDVNCIRFGSGPRTMVIVPGIYISRIVPAAEQLEQQLAKFAEHYTVYLIERRRKLAENTTVEEMAEDTAGVMKNCGISDAYLYGASQGGIIVQLIAAKHPELAAKAIIISSTSRNNELVKGVMTGFIDKVQKRQIKELGRDFAEKLYSPETIEKYPGVTTLSPDISETEFNNFAVMANACIHARTEDLLDQIQCPALIISGRLDRVFGEEESRYLSERLHCKYICYENYAHAVYDENPAVLDEAYAFFES